MLTRMPAITATLVNSAVNPAVSSAITSSSNGQILYACYASYGGDIYVSRNGGTSWSASAGKWDGNNPTVGNFKGIASSSDGIIVYAMWTGGGLLSSIDSGNTYTLNNAGDINSFGSIATDSSGIKLIACSGTYTYLSLNSGSTWTKSDLFTSSNYSYVACSSDFSKRYAVFGPDSGSDIYISTDPANILWTLLPGNITSPIRSITCDFTGTYIFTTDTSNNLYCITGGLRTLIGTSATYDKITCFGSGTSLGFAATGNNLFTTYTFSGIGHDGDDGGGEGGGEGGGSPPCFLEGSTILCEDKEIPIEKITIGTLVKTLNGYKKVESIGYSLIENPGSDERNPYRLYK